jgi:hypothetical protein
MGSKHSKFHAMFAPLGIFTDSSHISPSTFTSELDDKSSQHPKLDEGLDVRTSNSNMPIMFPYYLFLSLSRHTG